MPTKQVFWIAALLALTACAKAMPASDRSDAGPSVTADAAAPVETDQTSCAAAGGTCLLAPATGCSKIGPQDCNTGFDVPDARCCLDPPNVCTEDSGSIHASDYDQSCKVDADCTSVSEGLVACYACLLECQTGVINVNELSRYRSDLDKLPSPPSGEGRCNCPSITTPCCVDGQCHDGEPCGTVGRTPVN